MWYLFCVELQELANTLRAHLGQLTDAVRNQTVALLNERRRCESLSAAASVVCFTRYRANVVFAIIDLIEAIRNRVIIITLVFYYAEILMSLFLQRENFDEYALGVLESYYQCREAADVFEQIFNEITGSLEDFNELTTDIGCALELRNSIFEIYEEIANTVRTRVLALRVIRRRCQALPEDGQTRCWIEFRVEILLSVADTIRDYRRRQENFQETSLALLEAYYQCRA